MVTTHFSPLLSSLGFFLRSSCSPLLSLLFACSRSAEFPLKDFQVFLMVFLMVFIMEFFVIPSMEFLPFFLREDFLLLFWVMVGWFLLWVFGRCPCPAGCRFWWFTRWAFWDRGLPTDRFLLLSHRRRGGLGMIQLWNFLHRIQVHLHNWNHKPWIFNLGLAGP